MLDSIESLRTCRKELSVKHKKLINDFCGEEDELQIKILNLHISIASKEIDVLNLKIELAVTQK